MPSNLPSEDASTKTVDKFDQFTWDFPEGKFEHGEDDDDREKPRKGVPDGGGSLNPMPELLYDVTASQSLPSDANNPAARSDYYDRLQTGKSVEDVWPDEDAGVYAQDGSSSLPGVPPNDLSMDDFLGALGNAWSGYVVEDQWNPAGHPTPDLREPPEHKVISGGNTKFLVTGTDKNMSDRPMSMLRRVATNIHEVGELASSFLKEYGKKDLTRRHVMAFLQDHGHHAYLASDVIRCLKLRHQVTIADVLDQFPIRKAALDQRVGVAAARDRIIGLQAENVLYPEVAYALGRCAADLAHALAGLEKLEGRNG